MLLTVFRCQTYISMAPFIVVSDARDNAYIIHICATVQRISMIGIDIDVLCCPEASYIYFADVKHIGILFRCSQQIAPQNQRVRLDDQRLSGFRSNAAVTIELTRRSKLQVASTVFLLQCIAEGRELWLHLGHRAARCIATTVSHSGTYRNVNMSPTAIGRNCGFMAQ